MKLMSVKRFGFGAVMGAVLTTMLAVAPVGAQQGSTTGSITGRALDNTGSPISNVEIVARNVETGVTRTAVTKENGQYTFALLQPGTYVLRGEAPPMEPVEVGPIQVVVNEQQSVTITFDPVAIEGIRVQARGATIDAEESGVIETVSQEQLQSLPTAGRDFTDFINLSGLISPQPGIGTGGQFSIAGARTSATNVQIDGTDANNAFFGENRGSSRIPFTFSLESIREFQIITNGYDVEYGRFNGGVINAVTRGGTNEYRGSAFLFARDEALTAKNFDDTEPADFQSYQFGGTFSGPIIEDELHFFASGDFQLRQQPTFALVPERADIPASEINRFVSILENTYGLNAGDEIGQFDETDNQTAVFGRLDWQINDIHRATVRANYTNFENVNDRIDPSGVEARTRGGTFQDDALSVVGELNSVFSDRLFNTFRVQIADEKRPRPGNSYLPSAEVDVTDGSLGYGGAFFGILFDNNLEETKIQLTDNLTYRVGDHTFKIGTDNVLTNTLNKFWLNGNGFFTFDNLDDFEARDPGFFFRLVPANDQGEPQANPTAPVAEFNINEYSVYAQDEWDVTDRFRLSFGLRYDYTSFVDPALPIGAASIQTTMDGVAQAAIGKTVTTSTTPKDGDNLSPRLAFTYDLSDDDRSVLRGGAGLFYGRMPAVLHGNVMSIAPNPLLAVICIGSAVPDFDYENWTDGSGIPTECKFGGVQFPDGEFGLGILGAPEVTVWDEDFEMPETFKANLGYEQRISDRFKVGIQGIYSRTDNNFVTQVLELNPTQFTNAEGRPVFVPEADYDPTDDASSADRSRDPDLSRLYYQTSKGQAEAYNIKVDFEGYPTDDLRIGANYVWNYAYDNSSFVCCTANAGIFDTPTGGNPNVLGDIGDDREGNWGPSDFQRRHVFVLNGTYRMPLDFDVSVIYRAQSGNPYTPRVDGDLNADGDADNDRPFLPDPDNVSGVQLGEIEESTGDFVPGGALADYRELVNANECLAENVGGIVGRNLCSNPWWHRVDVKLRKGFNTFGDQRAELVVDLFNVLDGIGLEAGEFVLERSTLFRVEGYDAATSEPQVTVDDRFGSTFPAGFQPFQFQAQIGIRYTF